MEPARKTAIWMARAVMAMLIAGCAGAQAPAPPSPTYAPASARDATGLWQGTSTAGCLPLQPEARRCNAVEKITLRIFQKGAALSGDYTCATGTMVCRDTNTSGVIAFGEVREGGTVALRVMMPDGSSCLFNGRRAGDAMSGTYFCMQGGGWVERGRFSVERAY